MKILVPVNSVHEAETLVNLGAEELYCGLSPEAWRKSQGQEFWLNRRELGKANVGSLEELKELVVVAHRAGSQVFLTLNQPGYAPELYTDILTTVRQAQEYCGVDAFIVADPGLIRLLKEALPAVVIHVSSLAAVLNSAAVSFFSQLGVKRIIFPRYVQIETMKSIIERGGDHLEYEAFILNDGCVFEEGYCHVSHAFGGAFCHNPAWVYKPIKIKEEGNADQKCPRERLLRVNKETFGEHMDEYRRWLWIGIKNRGEMPGPKGYPLGMCGLCALTQLKEIGVESLKIVGREAPLKKRQQVSSLLRKCWILSQRVILLKR
ncbi:U32 family peptidase [Desulfosporosinus sp. OT]|uniref:peptidase U32 family protein n=1 Tax=Desulfosporosinus sp. OT TaxID=913865 RepID=UPI000223AB63|nr:U32 family peptidase [Desulfosporosinus sp. OT]EGW41803.1 peptidase U32 family protein [Desulfosporosinus sp. OT]